MRCFLFNVVTLANLQDHFYSIGIKTLVSFCLALAEIKLTSRLIKKKVKKNIQESDNAEGAY